MNCDILGRCLVCGFDVPTSGMCTNCHTYATRGDVGKVVNVVLTGTAPTFTQQPAPVSATEPYDENKAYADLYQEWITWSFEFIDTLNPEIPPSDSYQARTIIEDAFDTLRARVAELERVTEEQVERACSAYHGPTRWLEMAPNLRDTLRADMHNTLTAARGGG